MFNHVMHSAVVRAVQGLVGAAVFVQASQYVSLAGMSAMAVGAVLIILAGADVAPRPADSAGNA